MPRSFRSFASLLVLLLAASAPLFAADTYTVDKNHSDASFRVRHFASKVRGNFGDFEGTIQADPAKPETSSVVFTIKTASINTNNADRDKHLQSPGLLRRREVSRDHVQELEDRPGRQGQVQRHGDAHDARRLEGDDPPGRRTSACTKDPWGNERASFEVTTTLNRKDYGDQLEQGARRRRLDAVRRRRRHDQPGNRQEEAPRRPPGQVTRFVSTGPRAAPRPPSPFRTTRSRKPAWHPTPRGTCSTDGGGGKVPS